MWNPVAHLASMHVPPTRSSTGSLGFHVEVYRSRVDAIWSELLAIDMSSGESWRIEPDDLSLQRANGRKWRASIRNKSMMTFLANEPLTMPPVEFPVSLSSIMLAIVAAGAVVLLVTLAIPSLRDVLLFVIRRLVERL